MGLRKRILTAVFLTALCVFAAACSSDKGSDKEQDQTETLMETQSSGYRNDVSCAELESAVADALQDAYWPDADMPGLDDIGITPDMYTDYVYKVPMISVNVDTLIIVKAAEGRIEEVKTALAAYRENLINNSLQYPMNISKVQNSIVEEIGGYVVFVQLGADAAENASSEAVAENADISDDELSGIEADAVIEQNQAALDAIKDALAAE